MTIQAIFDDLAAWRDLGNRGIMRPIRAVFPLSEMMRERPALAHVVDCWRQDGMTDAAIVAALAGMVDHTIAHAVRP